MSLIYAGWILEEEHGTESSRMDFGSAGWNLEEEHRAESRKRTWLSWLLSNTDIGSAGLVLPSPSFSSICTV
jgi:hypothetical protein